MVVINATGTLRRVAQRKDGDPPLITSHPEEVSVDEGDSFSLTVVAEGTEPLTYQWQRYVYDTEGEGGYFWQNIYDEHSNEATYHVYVANQNDHDGDHRCVVTNDFGEDISETATVTVAAAPPEPGEMDDCLGDQTGREAYIQTSNLGDFTLPFSSYYEDEEYDEHVWFFSDTDYNELAIIIEGLGTEAENIMAWFYVDGGGGDYHTASDGILLACDSESGKFTIHDGNGDTLVLTDNGSTASVILRNATGGGGGGEE